MSEPYVMFASEIAELVAKDVRRRAHCQGFRSVNVHEIAEGQIPGVNWNADSGIDYGEAGPRSCDNALREIIPRMQRKYRLKRAAA